MAVRKAVLSVFNKNGIVEFARYLVDNEYEILSTGGTAGVLKEAGLPVTDVSDFTGFPEILNGRVKTLHPKIHAGILAMQSDEHRKTMDENNLSYIDMVVVNLYPFEETIAKPDSTFADAVEMIDIGGPTMLRAAAKNHSRVTVVCDPADYAEIIKMMENGGVTGEYKLKLAVKVFEHTKNYDTAIYNYLKSHSEV